jgi:hypothetical protein
MLLIMRRVATVWAAALARPRQRCHIAPALQRASRRVQATLLPSNATMIRSTALRLFLSVCLLASVAPLGMDRPALAAGSEGANWRVVLVAGDNAQPVFDNAVAAMARWLGTLGVPAEDIHRLSASPAAGNPPMQPASASRILHTIATLDARPGERCLVFMTSHGQRGEGVWLAYSGEFLHPAALAQALATGCGNVPTVVIVSSCYSGAFNSRVMRAPNRIILTAARADRPSFGCQADRTYTVFDQCLLGTLAQAANWRAVYKQNTSCVQRHEHQLGVLASQPQAYFGKPVRALGMP